MKVHEAYQTLLERVFFRGRRSRLSEAVAYILAHLRQFDPL
ncbi:MAG: hypothetical protein ABSF77_16365 [Spirochaetia bacterium]|jgi:hypothetical protein